MPQYLDYDGLRHYDGKIKEYVDEKVAGVGGGAEPDGSSIVTDEEGKLTLNADYLAYLDEKTYKAPAISAFSVTGASTSSVWVGAEVNPTAFTHHESNVGNINGTLTFSKGSTVIRNDVAVSASSVEVTLTETEIEAAKHIFTAKGSVSYTLKGTNSKGAAFSKSVTVNAYYPFYLGGSTAEALDGAGVVALNRQTMKNGIAGTYSVELAEDGYIYICCQESFSVNKVTSAGFDVALTQLDNVTDVDVNGVTCTYKVYRTPDPIGAGTHELVIS